MTYRLSICIPTLNRAQYIGETLDSIVSQMTAEVEVVIVDGGSIDGTEEIVKVYQRRFPQIRYIGKNTDASGPSNGGFDRDCNLAVELAQGEYCWLMTDDDLLVEGAIEKLFAEFDAGYRLIVVSVEIRNKNLTQVLTPRRPDLRSDRRFQPVEWNDFAAAAARHLTFVGAVVVRREFWLSREREKYFGTGFVHVGTIFDKPIEGDVLLIEKPLVIIRMGNAQWSSRAFQIWMFGWPQLIWSLSSISDEVKNIITPRNPWDNMRSLLAQRTFGSYSLREYRKFLQKSFKSKTRQFAAFMIAIIPRALLLRMAWVYAMTKSPRSEMMLFELRQISAGK